MKYALGIEKIGILLLSMTVLVTAGFVSNQAFAGVSVLLPNDPTPCEDCQTGLDSCSPTDQQCIDQWNSCLDRFMCRSAVGGDMIQMQTTSVLAAGAQYTAAWMIPVLVSAIGIGIVIARKF